MNQTKFISRRTFLTGVSAAAIAAASPALFAAPKPKAKALIILFSRSGNTAYLAERIHAETGAPILRIEPKVPYAPRYSDMTDGAREEIRKWSRREIKTKIPVSGWSYDEGKRCLVENDDPTAFGAGTIQFEVRENVEKFDFYKDDFENYQDIEDRVIGGITFRGRTYRNIG